MNLFGGKTFAHGIHPPESKDETRGLAIHQFPFAPLLIVPLSQHIGKPAVPIVARRRRSFARPDDRGTGRIHVGGDSRSRLRVSFAASLRRPASTARWNRLLSRTVSRFDSGSVRRNTACAPTRRLPSRSSTRFRQRASSDLAVPAFPHMPSCKIPEGKYRRHAGHQRSRMRTLPDDRSSRDAGTCR